MGDIGAPDYTPTPDARRPTADPVRTIARNTAVPIAAQLLNKVVDFGFVWVVARALGPTGLGQYEYAVLVWLYTKTFSDFGLAVLTTRDVAQRRELAGRYLGLTTLLRLALLLAALPAVLGFAFAGWRWLGLSGATTLAIAFLLASIVPDAYSDAATSICNAYERMAGPALLTIVKNALKVGVALWLLATGWGVVGLAVTALVTNALTAGLFTALVRRLGVRAEWRPDPAAARRLLGESWPLLLNNLLVGLFFRVDVFILQPSRGDRGDFEVGVYSAPYKYLNLLLLVPSYFTLALFPHLSRLAAARDGALAGTYALAVKLLLIVALPVTVATLFVAPELMYALGGPDFLPDSGTALRLLIWFLPFSYVNGLAQYVLIAAGQQRLITRAFALTTGFNLAANLLLTPRYGYVAAALITVASEVVLLVPFLGYLRRHVGQLPEPGTLLRPLAAAMAMGATSWAVYRGLAAWPLVAPWAAVAVGGLVYLAALPASRGIGATERRLALRLLGRAA